MNIEDACLFFHDSEDCPGVITSDPSGTLMCAECARDVGQVDSVLLSQIIAMLAKVPVISPSTR